MKCTGLTVVTWLFSNFPWDAPSSGLNTSALESPECGWEPGLQMPPPTFRVGLHSAHPGRKRLNSPCGQKMVLQPCSLSHYQEDSPRLHPRCNGRAEQWPQRCHGPQAENIYLWLHTPSVLPHLPIRRRRSASQFSSDNFSSAWSQAKMTYDLLTTLWRGKNGFKQNLLVWVCGEVQRGWEGS